MSKSFAVVNGDLQIGTSRSYSVVSGRDKLAQDLRLLVVEKIGHDPLLPTYGSRLDGGIIDGEEVDSHIGQLATQENLNRVRIEVIRLIENYQQQQFDKMANEAIIYGGRNTFDEDEVVDEILDVDAKQIATTVLVQVILSTLAGTSLKVTIPLTSEA
jgi:hypothetical protein